MARPLFNKIVEEIRSHSVEAVVPFFRGEPLLHPEFSAIMNFLRRRTSAKIQLATNGLLLNSELSRELLAMGIDFISFSLDAVTKKTYQKIRSGGDFDRTIQNVHNFLQIREGMSDVKTVVQVSATEHQANQKELPAFIDYWKPLVDRVRIYPQHSRDGRFGRLDGAGQDRNIADRQPCRKLFTDIVIYHDGNVGLCNHDWERPADAFLGSVVTDGIETVWQSPAYSKAREKHLSGRWDDMVPCSHCDHWQAMDEAETVVGDLIQ